MFEVNGNGGLVVISREELKKRESDAYKKGYADAEIALLTKTRSEAKSTVRMDGKKKELRNTVLETEDEK